MSANANHNLSTMASTAAVPLEELPVVEVFMSGETVSVKWGEGGAQQTTAGLSDDYTDSFHAVDTGGAEPFCKKFGSLIHCHGGILTIGQSRYRIRSQQKPNGKSIALLLFLFLYSCIQMLFASNTRYFCIVVCIIFRLNSRISIFCSFLALSLILSDRTRPSSSATQVAEIPFKNRDVECEQLAVLLLNNRKCLRLLEDKASTEQSQERLTLATSSQMFGAGKSAFGKNFLSCLATQEKTLTNLRERFGDAVDWLLGLVPVVIDCQHLRGDSLLESLREEFLRAASKHVPEEKHELANNKLGKFTLSTVSCADLFKIFEECTGSSFFIHLDEMSSTPDFNGIEKEVTLLHQIWTEIKTARFQSQSEVFCSGRSAALFLMGKGNGYGGKRSPENADCVLLDPLDDQHVADIFADFQVTNEQPFIGRLHDFTSGVPRFVAHAVNFFTGRAEGPGEKSPGLL
jgi:hypothetical protein